MTRAARLLTLSTRALALGAALSLLPVALVGLPVGASGLPLVGAAQPHPVETSRAVVPLTPVAARVPGTEDLVGLAAVPDVSPASRAAAGGEPAAGTVEPVRARSAALTAPLRVAGPVGVVGVVWDGTGPGGTVQLREHDGRRWGPWQDMEAEDDHGPDTVGAGAAEGRRARHGTAPYVVGGRQVQVRVLDDAATAPTGLRAVVVDPGTSDADATAGAGVAGAATAAAGRPSILTRKAWGADESMRRDDPAYGQAQIAFVHHTAESNSYSSAQVPAIIRGIYDYHVNGQEWNDIGYNFLVDRFGRTWEGRHGGVDRPVMGAQTANLNSWSFGVSVMGNFTSVDPPSAAVAAVQRVIAWKFSIHGMPAKGTVQAGDRTFNRISGHRDGVATSCPGARLYARLPAIRNAVAAQVGTLPRSSVDRDLDDNGAADLLAYEPPVPTTPPAPPATISGPVRVLRAAGRGPLRPWVRAGYGWGSFRSVSLTADLTGDGRPDVLALAPGSGNGRLRVYAGDGAGGFTGSTTHGTGWNEFTRVIVAGDRTGDGRADLLAVRSNGELRLYPGNGRGYVGASTVVGTGWTGFSSVVAAGDVDGDDLPDLLAVVARTGEQRMYAGTPGGGVAAGVVWGTGWGSFARVLGGGDLDGDGSPDVLVQQADGGMRTYFTGDDGAWERVNTWGSGWQAVAWPSMGVDFDGDGRTDVLAVDPSAEGGRLLLYRGTGRRDYDGAPAATLPSLPGADLARIVGDVDGDGRADAVVRVATDGSLQLLRGTASGFAEPVRIGTGWNGFTLVENAGDLNQDGVPDVLTRDAAGTMRLYPLRRDLRFGAPYEIGRGWSGVLSATGVGAFNADANGDVAALRWDHSLVLYRGSGHGAPLLDLVVLATGQSDLVRIVGANDFDGDGKRDILAVAAQGQVWLYRGNGSGGLLGSRQKVRLGEGTPRELG